MGLLTVVFLGMGVGADRATRYTEYSRSATTAMTLVHDEIEQLQAKVTTAPEFTAGNHADANNPITSTAAAAGTYTRTWTVTKDTPMVGLKTVAVQVAWTFSGQTQTMREVMVK
ncbi:MAG: hypothetical protein HY271_20775 [Deltaproteobacteria bacterium]|nr:hypothetical protein [Deltaproteobacteria bacterium]